MKVIQQAFTELKLSLRVVYLIHAFLDALLVFVVSLFLLFLFSLEWRFAFVPFLIYFGVQVYETMTSRLHLSSLEWKVLPLRYALRTAYDTQDVSNNELVNDLHADVTKNMKLVKTSYLINFPALSVKLLVLLFVTFFVGAMASLHVDFSGVQIFFSDIASSSSSGSGVDDDTVDTGEDVPLTLLSGNESNIYGDARIAQLGDTVLDLTITPSESDINLDEIGDVEAKSFTAGLYPQDVATNYDQSFQDDVPKENQEIVKNYFTRINQ